MPEPAPQVDPRTAADVVGDVEQLMALYAPEVMVADSQDPTIRHATGAAAALIGIFGRFAELVIQRLNRVPEKNQLAYFDLMGNALEPPQPARAPLTFSLAAGTATDVVVPPRTQVAATPAEGESVPVVFETEREVVVTVAKLSSLFVRRPDKDTYANLGALINSELATGIAVFSPDEPIEHILYIGNDSLFGLPGLTSVTLNLVLGNAGDPLGVIWEKCDGAAWTPVLPDSPVTLFAAGNVVFSNLPPLQLCVVSGIPSRWLRCRLLSGITITTTKPIVTSISLKAMAKRDGIAITQAFANNAPVDVTKDFLPFGERPKPGDTLYLTAGEAFSHPGSTVTLTVDVAESPPSAPLPILKWEFWNGKEWVSLGVIDQTNSFKTAGRKTVVFTLPPLNPPVATTVNGVEGFWIRVRIVSGDYGKAAQYLPVKVIPTTEVSAVKDTAGNVPSERLAASTTPVAEPIIKYELKPETFAPPSISSITVDYTLTSDGVPEVVLAYNDFVFEDFTKIPNAGFAPFRPTNDTRPTLYLGFTPPDGKPFPNKKISLYCGVDEIRLEPRSAVEAGDKPRLSWDYSGAAGWLDLQVRDESEALTRPGLVEFLGPPGFARRTEFGINAYWVRAVWDSGVYSLVPRLHSLLLNTVMAAHALTVTDETLGSSDGSAGQTFHTAHAPVLEGQRLEVREPELPSAEEHQKLKTESGEDSVIRLAAGTGEAQEIWVRWIAVPDFYASGRRDRHYVIESLSGEIRFGDGLNGMIPPSGSGNVKMILYRTGGGEAGNKPAGTITQLKTTVPYVEKVVNYEPAGGGADAETRDALIERAPRSIRHRGRAVTVEDYEDLARLASTAVARAKCVPLFDLEAEPPRKSEPGAVSVIIVPRSKQPKPVPSVAMIDQVLDYLTARKAPSARLSVVAPEYVRVAVDVEAAVTSLDGANEIELAIATTLAQFLHPLTGGLDGKGWDFGRRPHKSDLYALIEGVAGVDHIRALSAVSIDDRTSAQIPEISDDDGTGSLFLVYSGTHTITLTFVAP